MRTFKGACLTALLVALAISSIHCNFDDKLGGGEIPLDDGEFEEFYDYEVPEESEIDLPPKQEYSSPGGPQQSNYAPPPPPNYPDLALVDYPSSFPPVYQPQPVLPVPNYSAPLPPAYLPPPILPNYTTPVEYQAPFVQNYQAPVVSSYQAPIVQNYQAPIASSYQAPIASSYQAPIASSYQAPIASSYQAPIASSYQAPIASSYQAPAVSSYQAPVVSNYQAPAVSSYQAPVASSYQAPVVSNYQAPAVSSYQAPIASSYQAPVVSNYQAPAVSSYQASNVSSYQASNYQAPAVSNYQAPAVSNYQAPVASSYQGSAVSSYQAPVVSSYRPGNYSAVQPLINKYSGAELALLFPSAGYRANHWSLFYYRSSPYRNCPKNGYLSNPSYKDIEAAFFWAARQLQQISNQSIQYINSTSPSFSARHQVFSFLSQQYSRMDDEGLLLELVSQYLADRACLTKWDKQRYLPQLAKLISVSNLPGTHSCSNYYQSRNQWQGNLNQIIQSKYRTIDGFGNNPYHPYWGKSNVCHIRLLSPDYADGISIPRTSYNPRYPLPNPRAISNYIHNDVVLDSPYNLLKMQWGQFINHDITHTALSSYEGLVDCCKNPQTRGCWPIYVPPGDKFYSSYNVTCLNFIRSGVCPLCQLGPRQQINKNTAFLDASHVYGSTPEVAAQLRTYRGGLLKTSSGKNGEILLPIATPQGSEQCSGTCFLAGDSRVNQHPALTVLHTLLLRSHNLHAYALALRHPTWNDEYIFQEARRIVIAEYQMVTYGEYLPIVFGPILSSYYKLLPTRGHTYYEPKADPTTWNEYSTATCRFGHSQISSYFGLYSKIASYGQIDPKLPTYRLKEWFMRPSLLSDGLTTQIVNGLVGRQALAVDPWLTNDIRNHLYQSQREVTGGDIGATNIWRGRDHGIPGYVHYIEYCFNYKIRGWKDLSLFIPYHTLSQLRRLYRVVENIDLFTGGLAERHYPGADIGPTFACVNGIQYYHLKFGDRYFFEHGGQAGSFNPAQLEEIKRTTLARLLCRTAYLPVVPQYAFLQPSPYNPLVNCTQLGELNYALF